MLDKLHYFLPNTDESVHVYGEFRRWHHLILRKVN